MYRYNLLGSIIKITNGGCYLFFDFFFHFQKKYIPTPNRIYTPMNTYIGFTLSPKSHAMKRLVAVLNYLFLLMYARTTNTANMMMTIMCIGNYLLFDFFFHFQKKYIPTPNRIYTPMNIYIGFTLSPKMYARIRLRVVLICGDLVYLSFHLPC